MKGYFVRCWVRVDAENKLEAENKVDAILMPLFANGSVIDFKVMEAVDEENFMKD